MPRTFPPDVLVLDTEVLLHARLERGKKEARIAQAKTWRIPPDTFAPALVTPDIANDEALADVFRQLRAETGRWDKVSVLLPDAWFRINLIDLPSLPDKRQEADEVIRWGLKRMLPISPADLRLAWEILARSSTGVKVLVVSAVEKTLAGVETLLAAAGCEVVLMESVGLNIWNAVTSREPATSGDRIFFYVRRSDFPTAVFRGSQPLFIRSRNLNGERSLIQEMKLSATYLRDTVRLNGVEQCYVAGSTLSPEVTRTISEEFGAPVRLVALRDFVEQTALDGAFEAELTACTGVFTA